MGRYVRVASSSSSGVSSGSCTSSSAGDAPSSSSGVSSAPPVFRSSSAHLSSARSSLASRRKAKARSVDRRRAFLYRDFLAGEQAGLDEIETAKQAWRRRLRFLARRRRLTRRRPALKPATIHQARRREQELLSWLDIQQADVVREVAADVRAARAATRAAAKQVLSYITYFRRTCIFINPLGYTLVYVCVCVGPAAAPGARSRGSGPARPAGPAGPAGPVGPVGPAARPTPGRRRPAAGRPSRAASRPAGRRSHGTAGPGPPGGPDPGPAAEGGGRGGRQ